MAETDLKRLFSQVREGDREAFAAIYGQLKQPVYTICCRITQSRETAEDVTHDVFVKLFVSPPEPSVENPRAWVFRMARNLAIDALRKSSHTEPPGVLAGDEAERIHLRLDLEAAIGTLDSLERQVLALHINGGLNFRDTGAIVGLSLPAAYRTYRKALKKLRDELNGGAI